ncbi:hypothetical protein Tco_0494937 [Tanacetum coccineum]
MRDIASWVEWSWCGWTRVRRKGNSAGGFGGMWERMNSDLFTGCRLGDLARTVPERVICYYRDGPCSFQIWPLQFGLGLHQQLAEMQIISTAQTEDETARPEDVA